MQLLEYSVLGRSSGGTRWFLTWFAGIEVGDSSADVSPIRFVRFEFSSLHPCSVDEHGREANDGTADHPRSFRCMPQERHTHAAGHDRYCNDRCEMQATIRSYPSIVPGGGSGPWNDSSVVDVVAVTVSSALVSSSSGSGVMDCSWSLAI